MGKRLTYEYVKEYIEKEGYKLLSNEYIGNRDKLLLKCPENHELLIAFNKFQQGCRCRQCRDLSFRKERAFSYNYVYQYFLNYGYILLSNEYINNSKKLKVKCPEGHEFLMSFDNFKQGERCSVCWKLKMNKDKTLTYDEVKSYIESFGYKLLSDNYVNANEKILIQCNKGHIYEVKYGNFQNGQRCPYCFGRLPSKENNLLVNNPDLCIEWNYEKNKKKPEEYTPNSGQKVWWKCKECGYEWEYSIDGRNGKHKIGCLSCSSSKGETKIKTWLDQHQISYKKQKTFNNLKGTRNGLLSYDFYLPQFNLLIEYQGQFHDGNGNYYLKQNLKKQQEHDKRKREYAEQNNIELLEIWYWDFNNIEQILSKKLNITN